MSIEAYTSGDPTAIIELLRRKIAVDSTGVRDALARQHDKEVALAYEPTQFYTILVMAFSCSALALTSVGLFPLVSHTAARRTGEMGLRMALGASRASAADRS